MNSNIRDPKVNNGDWKAMVYSLNCNIRDPKVNNGEWRAMSKGGLRLRFRYHPIFTNLQTKATPNILRRGTTMFIRVNLTRNRTSARDCKSLSHS